MGWARYYLKNSKVYARTGDDGALLVTDGKVEICYKPDDPRVYTAAAKNLRPIEDGPPPPPSPDGGKARPKVEPKVEASASALAAHTAPKRRGPASQAAGSGRLDREAGRAAGPGIDAWTDGACSGNPGDAGLGVVMIYGAKRLELSRYLGKATNNIAELEAIRAALLMIRNKSLPVRIHTDSAYSLGVLTRGWKAKKNPALVEDIRTLMREFAHLDFVKVEGHAGVPENERADALARMAVENRTNWEQRT